MTKPKAAKRTVPPKAAVLALVERDGMVRSQRIANVNAKTLGPILAKNIDQNT